MAAISNVLRHDLQQPEFAEGYAESFLDSFIATQLRVLREQNGWSQAELAERMGKKQTVISRSENVNYSSWSISTLKQYARAFRLRLRVSFETYGSLVDEVADFSRENLQRTPRESDPALNRPEAKTGQNSGMGSAAGMPRGIHLVCMSQAGKDAAPLPSGNNNPGAIAQGMGSLSHDNFGPAIPPQRASCQANVLEGIA
jgi:HTH-type transcriptional regulator/antitoxin HipB